MRLITYPETYETSSKSQLSHPRPNYSKFNISIPVISSSRPRVASAGIAKRNQSAEALCLEACRGPDLQQPSKPPKPQTSPQGGGFTLPLPPPYRLGLLGCSFSWRPPAAFDPSKSNGKTNEKPAFSILGHIKPPHIPITLAIYGLR